MGNSTSPFRQYDSNEALLLMYLAGELSAHDRREVDEALAADASLRGELASLRELQGSVFGKLAALDGAAAMHEHSQAARASGRWVAAAVRRRALTAPVRVTAASGQMLSIRRLRYAIAAAAAVIAISVVVWRQASVTSRADRGQAQMPNLNQVPLANSGAEERIEERLDYSFDGSAEKSCETLALSNSGQPLFAPDNSADDRSDGN